MRSLLEGLNLTRIAEPSGVAAPIADIIPALSAEDIIKGAFEVAEGISLDKLSMPELARHLGVGVTSIYWYFRKDLAAGARRALRRATADLQRGRDDGRPYAHPHLDLQPRCRPPAL